jgi:hypothetical protein
MPHTYEHVRLPRTEKSLCTQTDAHAGSKNPAASQTDHFQDKKMPSSVSWMPAHVPVPMYIQYRSKFVYVTNPGSMLWSQFSAIFSNFRRKNWCFFLNSNVMINFFQNLALSWVKNANFFAKNFGENILKIITSVPDLKTYPNPRSLLWIAVGSTGLDIWKWLDCLYISKS